MSLRLLIHLANNSAFVLKEEMGPRERVLLMTSLSKLKKMPRFILSDQKQCSGLRCLHWVLHIFIRCHSKVGGRS